MYWRLRKWVDICHCHIWNILPLIFTNLIASRCSRTNVNYNARCPLPEIWELVLRKNWRHSIECRQKIVYREWFEWLHYYIICRMVGANQNEEQEKVVPRAWYNVRLWYSFENETAKIDGKENHSNWTNKYVHHKLQLAGKLISMVSHSKYAIRTTHWICQWNNRFRLFVREKWSVLFQFFNKSTKHLPTIACDRIFRQRVWETKRTINTSAFIRNQNILHVLHCQTTQTRLVVLAPIFDNNAFNLFTDLGHLLFSAVLCWIRLKSISADNSPSTQFTSSIKSWEAVSTSKLNAIRSILKSNSTNCVMAWLNGPLLPFSSHLRSQRLAAGFFKAA